MLELRNNHKNLRQFRNTIGTLENNGFLVTRRPIVTSLVESFSVTINILSNSVACPSFSCSLFFFPLQVSGSCFCREGCNDWFDDVHHPMNSSSPFHIHHLVWWPNVFRWHFWNPESKPIDDWLPFLDRQDWCRGTLVQEFESSINPFLLER